MSATRGVTHHPPKLYISLNLTINAPELPSFENDLDDL